MSGGGLVLRVLLTLSLFLTFSTGCPRRTPAAAPPTLHVVAVHYPDQVAQLIKSGQNPNGRNAQGQTPLVEAAVSRSTAGVRALLENGANPNLANAGGEYALTAAARTGDEASVHLLLEHKADPNAVSDGRAALHWATRYNRIGIVDALLDRGADINLKEAVTGRTPIHLATVQGHADLIKRLLDKGARTDVKDDLGQTPLDFIRVGGSEGIRALLESAATRPTTAASMQK